MTCCQVFAPTHSQAEFLVAAMVLDKELAQFLLLEVEGLD